MAVQLVPWYNKQEWLEVKNGLMGDDFEKQKKAVQQLAVWSYRCRSIPRGVECTRLLMEVYCKDKICPRGCQPPEVVNENDLQLMYCTALIRFINFALDLNTGDKTRGTMFEYAEEVDIPSWIVEIRHDIAHGKRLPSLSLLQLAVKYSLNWLFDKYWASEDVNDITELKKNTKDISLYKLWFYVATQVAEHQLDMKQLFDNLEREMQEVILRNFKQNFNYLAENCTLEQFQIIILKKLVRRFKHFESRNLVYELLSEDSSFFSYANEQNGSIDPSKLLFWSDFLSILAKSLTFPFLMEELIRISSDNNLSARRQRLAALWIKELSNGILRSKTLKELYTKWPYQPSEVTKKKKKLKDREKYNERIQGLLDKKFPHLTNALTLNATHCKFDDMLKLAVSSPNGYTLIFIENLMMIQEEPLSDNQQSHILQLIDIYTGSNLSDGIKDLKLNDSELYTVMDLPENSEETHIDECNNANDTSQRLARKKQNGTDCTAYEAAWRNCPLGASPWRNEMLMEL